jgi:hypothetical protein
MSGMTLDFSVKGQVKASMFDYIDSILTDFKKSAPKDDGIKVTATPIDLFAVDEDCEKLTCKQSIEFHHLVAKTLFETKFTSPDTGTSMSFLSTQVRRPDQDDGESWSTSCTI